LREALKAYFEEIVESEVEATNKPARLAWRLSCFDSGTEYARYIEEHHFPLKGRRVLDASCAWGGHALALAQRSAEVIGSDLNDHRFASLSRFSKEQNLKLSVLQADVEQLPFVNQSFDVILALELVEHINAVDKFAAEVNRILKPGGICVISTPARLKSLVWGEPHYGIKGLTFLPLSWQRHVATKIFQRSYPYPITRQYTTASQVIHPFAALGLTGFPKLQGRLVRHLQNRPRRLRIAQEFLWNFVILTKPALPSAIHSAVPGLRQPN
jgi:ubiquinone/menaquinone biosynthesis C-methylase UbiE